MHTILRPGRLSSGLGRTGALLAALLVLPIYALEMIVHWAELSRQRMEAPAEAAEAKELAEPRG